MGRTARAEPQCLYKGDLYLIFTQLQPKYELGIGLHLRSTHKT